MHAATHLHLLATELAAAAVSDGVAVDRLLQEAAGHDEHLLGALMHADRMVAGEQVAAEARRAAMLLQRAVLRSHEPSGGRRSTRLGAAWSTSRPQAFADALLEELGRLQAAAAAPESRPVSLVTR